MLLAVDVGNTQTVLGLFEGERLADSFRLATDRSRTGDELGVEAQTVATGGLADLIVPHTRTVARVDPHLTLEGLRLVWSRNA